MHSIAVNPFNLRAIVSRISMTLALLATAGCSTPERPRINLSHDVLRTYEEADIPRPAGPVTIDDAIALALEHNPDLRVLREELKVVETLRTGAIKIKDPELRISYGNSSEQQERYVTMPLTNSPWVAYDLYDRPITDFPYGSATSRRITSEDARDYQVTARFFPPNPWLLRNEIRTADAAIAAARANVAAMEWDILMSVRNTFAQAQHLQADISCIDRLIALGSNTISLMELRVSQGTATLLDIVNSSRNHLTLISERSAAERDYAVAIQSLASFLGVGASDIVLVPSTERMPELDPGTVDSTFLESFAVRNRLDLTARILALRHAETVMRLAETESMPWLTFVQGSVGRNTGNASVDPLIQWTGTDGFYGIIPSTDTQWENDHGTSWRIDAGITIPFFSWMTPPAVPERAECIRKAAAVIAASKRIVADVRDAVKGLQSASANMARYASTSARDTTRLRSILATSAQQGTLGPDDRAKIETALLEVQRSTSKLEYEYRQAYMSLTTRVGRDLSFLWGTKRPDDKSTELKKASAIIASPTESPSAHVPPERHPPVPEIPRTTHPVAAPAVDSTASEPVPTTIAPPLQPIKKPVKTGKPAKISTKPKANAVLLESMSRRQAEWSKQPKSDVKVPAPVVEAPAPAPVVEAPAPVVEVPAPVVEAPAPVVEVPAPVVEAPVVEAPVVEVPVVEVPVVEVPVVEAPVVEVPVPVVE